jgi:hypothetical protein
VDDGIRRERRRGSGADGFPRPRPGWRCSSSGTRSRRSRRSPPGCERAAAQQPVPATAFLVGSHRDPRAVVLLRAVRPAPAEIFFQARPGRRRSARRPAARRRAWSACRSGGSPSRRHAVSFQLGLRPLSLPIRLVGGEPGARDPGLDGAPIIACASCGSVANSVSSVERAPGSGTDPDHSVAPGADGDACRCRRAARPSPPVRTPIKGRLHRPRQRRSSLTWPGRRGSGWVAGAASLRPRAGARHWVRGRRRGRRRGV